MRIDRFVKDCSPSFTCRSRGHVFLPMLALAIVGLEVVATPAQAQETAGEASREAPASVAPGPIAQPISQDCFDELENGKDPMLACRVPLRLSHGEQAELEKGTRGYVKNVSCLLTIEIRRDALQAPIEASEHIFESPEQPVSCTVTTYKTTFDVTATFAPRIVFKANTAVEAWPGLGNVKGVSRVLSWPVVQFVNRWPSIRKGMLQVVNAYLLRERERIGKKESAPRLRTP